MSISAKIGYTGQTLSEWVKKSEVDAGKRAAMPTDMAAKLKTLERGNRELRQANEILRKASAYFAQAKLDRPRPRRQARRSREAVGAGEAGLASEAGD
jgi:transposase